MEKQLYALTDGTNVFDVKDFTSIEAMYANVAEEEKGSGLHWQELGES